MPQLTEEQFLPIRWVTRGVTRKALADHLAQLRRFDRQLAKRCAYQCHWIGIYPIKRRN